MKILVIAPHPDDEIIGVGATIVKYVAQGHIIYVCVTTKGSMPLFEQQKVMKTRRETIFAHELLEIKETFFLDFPAVMLEQIPRHEINDKILTVVSEVEPDIVYIPHFGDMQKDHQIIAEAAMVALRRLPSH